MKKFININLNITDIVLACWVAPAKGGTTHSNRHSHGLALNCGEDKKYIFSDGKEYLCRKNHFIYLPKNSTYTVNSNNSGNTYCINFQLANDDTFNPFVFHLKNTDEVIQAYKNAEKAWRRKTTGYKLLCKSELYKILYILHNAYTLPYTPNLKQALLEPAISYIHKNYSLKSISVKKLSELCGFSYEYFRRLFYGCYGCSPVKYINALRLKRSKELLNSGFYTVSDAALNSGFSDFSYFSRFFKKHVGISPNDYLNRR